MGETGGGRRELRSCQETAVRMVGVTYRSNSARPNNAASKFVFPAAAQAQDSAAQRGPAPSFKDKESYNELFKPLPKPDPAPSFAPIKFEAKSWKQLQEERESLMTSQLEKTKCEAMELWNRAKTDDQQRINKISDEQRRIEEESRAREEILRRGDDERIARDKARKEELRRQEELLSGRKTRSKTTEPSVDDIRGGGIQILHYKDPAVEKIIRNHHKEEIKRRMSHGEILKMPPSEIPQHRNPQPHVPSGAGLRSTAASSSSLPPHSPVSSNSSSTSVNEYKVETSCFSTHQS